MSERRAAMIRVEARAKVNLYLHVTGRRADGYHLLDSLVVFPAIGDTVEVQPADLPKPQPAEQQLVIARRRSRGSNPDAQGLDRHAAARPAMTAWYRQVHQPDHEAP